MIWYTHSMELGNLHPIIVHFPIALLTVYAGLELLKSSFIEKLEYLFYIKGFMVIIGAIGSTFAIASGLYTYGGLPNDPISIAHSWWAYTTAFLFGTLAFVYAVEWYYRERKNKNMNGVFKTVHKFLYRPDVLFMMALAGIISVTVTGALGGLMVHGPENDPMTKLLFEVFFKQQ